MVLDTLSIHMPPQLEFLAVQRVDIHRFVAKIGSTNKSSQGFFERHGFRQINEKPNVFDELEYELDAGDVPIADLNIKSLFNIQV